MSARSSLGSPLGNPHPHAEFLVLVRVVERHARVVFRDRNEVDREEAVAEALAAAFESYVALKQRGQDPVQEFPSVMARFAVLHVKGDRHVGGRSSSRDVLSRKAQWKHAFRVESLPSPHTSHQHLYSEVNGQRRQDAFEERLQESRKTPIPDLVAIRVDFRDFLQTLTPRDRELAEFLSLGHSAKAATETFKLSQGRVTQLRQQWHREWLAFQGETVVNE